MLLVNPKTRGFRKLFVFENDFKTYFSKTFDAYRPKKDVKLRPKRLSDSLEQMSSINYQNLCGCAIKKFIRNIHK